MNKLTLWIKEHWSIILINVFLIFYAIKEGLIDAGSEDFRIFIGAAKALNQLSNLYFVYFETGKGDAMPYAYTPFFAMILSPFQLILSSKAIVFIWLLLNIVFINRIIFLIDKFLIIKNKHKFFIIVFLFALRFVLHNYDMAQVTIFWVYLMFEAFYQLEYKEGNKTAGFLIALGVSVKILPVAMFLYFLIKKRFSTFFFTILFGVFLNILPFMFYPTDYLIVQYKDCWKTIYPFQEGFTYQLFDRATQGIPSLVSNYNQVFGNLFNHIQTLGFIVLTSIVWLLGIVIIYIKSPTNRYKNFILFSFTLFSATMLMPHQQHYSFFSAIGLYALWAYWIWEVETYSKTALFVFILSTMLMIFTSDLFVGNELKSLFKSYGAIGLGGILLVLSAFMNILYVKEEIF
jgi:hypothetical protein